MSQWPSLFAGFFQLITKVWMPLSTCHFTIDFSGLRSWMYISLICSGIVSCGITWTSSVVGAYWVSSIIGVRWAT